MSFVQDILSALADRGRSVVGRSLWPFSVGLADESLPALLKALLGGRGEASGVALAREIMRRYRGLDAAGRTEFLLSLATVFSPDIADMRAAFAAYEQDPSPRNLRTLTKAVEAPRQEIIRRLNLAPGNTAALVAMRADLLERLDAHPELEALNQDFVHLFSSWFNRGFLLLRPIDWSTPADILEKIIRYEAVHAIESWDDLRRRIEPPDRRCFAFFHPALASEPLIFVEVALTTDMPAAIAPLLAADRTPIDPVEARTAVFYSISNCQTGLAGISFGNFLIKQVVEELRRDLPGLTTFVTLSPVPGFARWLDQTLADPASTFVDAPLRTALAEPGAREAEGALRTMLATYLVQARTPSGRPIDPVARFHLGNGARLERLNMGGDRSTKGLRESHGAMVNYLYDLRHIEDNHERFAAQGEVVASAAVLNHVRAVAARATATEPPKARP